MLRFLPYEETCWKGQRRTGGSSRLLATQLRGGVLQREAVGGDPSGVAWGVTPA